MPVLANVVNMNVLVVKVRLTADFFSEKNYAKSKPWRRQQPTGHGFIGPLSTEVVDHDRVAETSLGQLFSRREIE